MNLDANIQKIVTLLLKKWQLIVVVALIGTMLAYFYTANFTTLTYTSTVEFLAYVQDTQQELNDSSPTASASYQTASNTSKMNYVSKMLNTYVELFKTNEFNQSVANDLKERYNTSYSAGEIKGSVNIQVIEETTMFKVSVTTNSADKSYQIAKQLEKSIPEKMESTNNGLVNASIEDSAVKASAPESKGYPKKIMIGFIAGAVLAAAYIILRDLLDVRVKTAEELSERYGIPVLGTIPEFELKSGQSSSKGKGPSKSQKGE